MKCNKKIIILPIIAAMAIAFGTGTSAQAISTQYAQNPTIDTISDGMVLQLENKPFIENGEVYFPVRELTSLLDDTAQIGWDNGTVSVRTAESAYLLNIGSDEVSVNPIAPEAATYAEKADNAAILQNDRTFVPYSMLTVIFDVDDVNYAVYDDAARYEMAKIWANAMITRDGEPRYQMMTADMQKEFIAEQMIVGGENWNYVIGYSSPKTKAYNIAIAKDRARITYYQRDNTDEVYVVRESIAFAEENGEVRVSGSAIATD